MRGSIGVALMLGGIVVGAGAMVVHAEQPLELGPLGQFGQLAQLTKRAQAKRVRVVLSREGGPMYAGGDDARARMSSSLGNQGIGRVDLQAFDGDDLAWSELLTCVQSRYSAYDVTIVDSAPARGDFILAAIGGPPSQLGLPSTVGGLAPHNGSVIPGAVVFAFQTPSTTADELCQTTAHEIGHALGLDHTRLCSDVMSYEYCGSKHFQDEAARCGEWEARDCDSGESHQSSHEILTRNVGRREAPRSLAMLRQS